jgi:hypothetical protein
LLKAFGQDEKLDSFMSARNGLELVERPVEGPINIPINSDRTVF